MIYHLSDCAVNILCIVDEFDEFSKFRECLRVKIVRKRQYMLTLRKKLITSVYRRIDNESSCLSEDVLSKGQCLVVVKESFENVYSDVKKKKKCLCLVFEYERCNCF